MQHCCLIGQVKSDHVAWILASDWLVCLLSWCNIAVWLTDWHQWRSHVLGMIPPWQWREPRYTEADPSSGHPRQELTPDTWPRNVKHDCIIINRLKAWTNNLSWESGSSIWIWRHICLENRIGLLWKDEKSFLYNMCILVKEPCGSYLEHIGCNLLIYQMIIGRRWNQLVVPLELYLVDSWKKVYIFLMNISNILYVLFSLILLHFTHRF